jgi:hypothetical protein
MEECMPKVVVMVHIYLSAERIVKKFVCNCNKGRKAAEQGT